MPLTAPSHWHDEVPGTRWFRADLHIHTLDDHGGGRMKLPPELAGGDPCDPGLVRRYARMVLDVAVRRGVEVLGLTPHDVRTAPNLSAAWSIVEAWQEDSDEAGRRYRDLIYAIFPGFEPAANVGRSGLHLLFLFDPAIGKDRYLRLFDALMGGVKPWQDKQLRMSNLDERTLFEVLDDFHRRENATSGSQGHWDHMLLAPHAFSENGLFGTLRSGALAMFPSHRLAGIELGDNQMPEDAERGKDWLPKKMMELRHAFYHASDAYGLDPDPTDGSLFKLGSRVTLVKLASPTTAALKQSFLASASRLRLAYEKAGQGTLRPARCLPEACPVQRPWLRAVSITGGTSFHSGQTFRFSPDLTCVIGGSMTGKSTLLDGLRLELSGEHGLPDSRSPIGQAIRARALQSFRSGNPQVVLDSPWGDPTRPVAERFDARFFGQGELKNLSEDNDGIEHLLFHLVPGRAEELLRQRDELREHDAELSKGAARLAKLLEQVADTEQAFQRTQDARAAMERFAQAGTASLPPAQQDVARTSRFMQDVRGLRGQAEEFAGQLDGIALPQPSGAGGQAEPHPLLGPSAEDLLAQARAGAAQTLVALTALHELAATATSAAQAALAELTARVQSALVAMGGSATDLNAFEQLARAAQNFDSFKAALDQKIAERDHTLQSFNQHVAARDELIAAHRAAVQQVCDEVGARFEQKVVVQLQKEGRREALEAWLLGFKTAGITTWWRNGGAEKGQATKLRDVAKAVWSNQVADAQRLCTELGMSAAVARSFLEQLAPRSRQLEAWALRAPDRYQIQWVEDGVPKDLDALSGGRKVAVLLSLLLASDDPTPLVIDQPEDELDNRFLNETIIPALHRLKGKRQVIFATHNANIVVNGDADQVIALEADAQHGRVYAAGAIEEKNVREAILNTLDGGEKAFELRRAKYGF